MTFKKIRDYILNVLKWLLLAGIMGIIGGILGAVFHRCLEFVTETREEHSLIILLLPIVAVLITALYRKFSHKGNLSTNGIIASAEADGEIPLILAPLIFVSTLITHLFGGSAGREGAALQLGGSIGYSLGRVFRLDKAQRRIIVMAGMSSFFSAMFGAPLTAAVFSVEVIKAPETSRRAFMPCIIASAVSCLTARLMGATGIRYTVPSVEVGGVLLLKVAILAALCAIVSILFVMAIEYCGKYMSKLISNEYLKSLVGGAIIVLLALALGTFDYNGAGMKVVDRAMNGEAEYVAFALKIIFTAVTIAAGLKGGEIVPTLFIGATFGCAFGGFVGLDSAFAASVGFIALFCGVIKCPLAAIALALEVFGGNGILAYAVATAVTYALSGSWCIYKHTERKIDLDNM